MLSQEGSTLFGTKTISSPVNRRLDFEVPRLGIDSRSGDCGRAAKSDLLRPDVANADVV
jgi:hypothetical protein